MRDGATQPTNDALLPEDRALLRDVADSCTRLRTELRDMREEVRTLLVGGGLNAAEIPESLNPKEATAYLKLPSVRALYQAVRRGQVPVHRIGRRMRFLKAELDAVLVRR